MSTGENFRKKLYFEVRQESRKGSVTLAFLILWYLFLYLLCVIVLHIHFVESSFSKLKLYLLLVMKQDSLFYALNEITQIVGAQTGNFRNNPFLLSNLRIYCPTYNRRSHGFRGMIFSRKVEALFPKSSQPKRFDIFESFPKICIQAYSNAKVNSLVSSNSKI